MFVIHSSLSLSIRPQYICITFSEVDEGDGDMDVDEDFIADRGVPDDNIEMKPQE